MDEHRAVWAGQFEEGEIDGKLYITLGGISLHFDMEPEQVAFILQKVHLLDVVQFGDILLYNKDAAERGVRSGLADQERARQLAERQHIERETLQKAIERGTLFS